MAPRYIAPMEPPKVRQPSDEPDKDHKLELGGSELFLFDIWAQEKSGTIEGTDCDIWIRSLAKSKIDPYYGEPTSNSFDGPFALRAFVEWPEATPEAGEDGKTQTWPSSIWISRLSLEQAGGRGPTEGDIARFWHLPYFDNGATSGVKTPGGGFFFSMTQVNDDGHLHDSAMFVGFRCYLKRLSQAPPELNFNIEKGVNDDC